MDINMDKKIDLWKNKLLDLGKRNRLISYHETKHSTLSILKPSIFDLWDTLVKNEKPIEFPYYDDTEEFSKTENRNEDSFNNDNCINTNQDISTLQKTLRNLRNKARTSEGEQGIHILHLAFGFLKWKEIQNSENYIYSPLILVPVNLTIKSISSPYVMELSDDEIVFNPALRYKLEQDFGLVFPEFEEDTDLEMYLKSIDTIIKGNNWKVDFKSELSLFSFLKINMYNDLIQHKNEIVSNPNIRAICGDSSCISTIPDELENYNFDKKDKPIDIFQIVDADSSQQEAVLLAKNGVSFVMQGPPGTGKSQTITNIIAQCLADGKKVLFVSEKMAALDVVYRRLTTAGLNDFCLVLHSHKAKKKAVLEQLRTVLNFSKTKAQLSDEAYVHLDTLYNDRERLNNYAEQVFEIIKPLNKSIYEVNGILANLEDYNEIIFDIKDIRNITNEKYNRFIYALNQFKSTIGSLSEDYSSNPWKGANVQYVTNELRHDIKAKSTSLCENLYITYDSISCILEKYNLNLKPSYSTFLNLEGILSFSERPFLIPTEWIYDNKTSDLKILCCDAKIQTEKIKKNVIKLNKIIAEINSKEILNMDNSIVSNKANLEDISIELQNIENIFKSDYILSNLVTIPVKNFNLQVDKLKEMVGKLTHLKEDIEVKFNSSIYTIPFDKLLYKYKKEYENLKNSITQGADLKLTALIQEDRIIPENWIITNSFIKIIDEFNELKNKSEEIDENLKLLNKSYRVISEHSEYDIKSVDNLNSNNVIARQQDIFNNIFSNNKKIYGISISGVSTCESQIRYLKEKNEKIKTIKDDISKDFSLDILSQNCYFLLNKFNNEYKSILKIFNKNYRKDYKNIKSYYNHTEDKLSDSVIISVLEKASEIEAIKSDIDEKCKDIISIFVEEFDYENTQFEQLNSVIVCYREIINSIDIIRETKEIIGFFADTENNYKLVLGNIYNGLETDWIACEDCLNWTSNFRNLLISDLTILEPYQKYKDTALVEIDLINILKQLRKIELFKQKIQTENSEVIKVFEDDFLFETTDFDKIGRTYETFVLLQDYKETILQIKESLLYFNNNSAKFTNEYKFLYNGTMTNWDSIYSGLSWTTEIIDIVNIYNLNKEFIRNICVNETLNEDMNEYRNAIKDLKHKTEIDFNWFVNLFDNGETFFDYDLLSIKEKITSCTNNLFLLEEWIDFKRARKECLDEGLEEYINKVETINLDKELIVPTFKKRFFRLWLDSVMTEYPAVMDFRRLNQENLINEFKELDKMQFEIAKARIKGKLINDLPVFDKISSGLDEVGILRRELSKQRRIMPIRKLFKKIPNLLLTLKPCLMMSPLSVSLFLEASSYKFDTVIFDEASQVMTENAIGAIFRGNQVIIAGDSKQLPPTNFFTASTSESDYDIDEENDDDVIEEDAYESILDEANLLPEKTLLWHYRSRHEHLIAFSNAKIYHNNLITFPSNVDKAKDTGVEYVYVQDGFYDIGGKRGNILEAQKVAELVFEHFKKYPNRTLGVVAFGEVQQEAIETQIRKMRMKYQGFEPFFNEENDEPFFVKNLENVQGDERDTIIFSIGYAKDSNGVFRMNFGPLSKSGGERRLNVAITRAKYNVKLVGSIMPTEIDIDRISSEGPKLLRSYIDFAINGVSVLNQEITESDIVETDSPFEDAVYNFLDRKGYRLATQVGCSGYRIDMAVKHPTISGQYVLGIECDGATYHSAKTARERDRLRQDVLENMGWKIYRIWSTDWIKDPITEGKRLINAIEDAIKSYGVSEESCLEYNEPEAKDFINLEEKSNFNVDADNPYGFEEQKEISFYNLQRNKYGKLGAIDCIMEIVNKMYPVHFDIICKELLPLYGHERICNSVRDNVSYWLNKMNDKLICKDNFYSPIGDNKVIPRKNNNRKIDYVSEEELSVAMLTILNQSVGITKDILITETARSYNYFRITQKISDKLNNVFNMLLETGKIEIHDEKVV